MTNKKGQPKKDLPDYIVKMMRKQRYKKYWKIKTIYNYFKDHYNICERTVRRAVNYETYKDIK